MDQSDKTPISNYIGSNSQQGLSGFALYESAVDFFKKLGIAPTEIAELPEIIMTSVGSLLKENDDYNKDLAKLVRELSREKNNTKRLRAQRDALRAMFQRIGHDPMPDYQSQVGMRALPDPDNPSPSGN